MAGIFTVTEASAESIVQAQETSLQRSEQVAERLGTAVMDCLLPDNALDRKIRSLLGTPYLFGGDGDNGIDCSAFVRKVFAALHITLPRTAREQYTHGKVIPLNELRKGDLIFFTTYARYASHVGIYLGNHLMAHASSGHQMVTVSSVDTPYFHARYLGARRIDDDLVQEPHPTEIVELGHNS